MNRSENETADDHASPDGQLAADGNAAPEGGSVSGGNAAPECESVGSGNAAPECGTVGGGDAATDDDGAVVAWSISPTDTRLGRVCAYALLGLGGGVALLLVALAALFVATTVATGEYGTLALAALLVLVGGPFSVLALASFLDADQRPDDLGPFGRVDAGALDPLGVAASALLGAAGVVATFASGTVLAVYPLLGVLFLASMGLAVGGPEGRVDRDAGTLAVRGNAQPLADLAAVRTVELGGLVLVNARFVARPGGRDAPFLFAMPSDAYQQVADAFAEGVTADSAVADARTRGERVAVAATGVGALALAAGLVAVATTSSVEGAGVLSFVATLPALFGVLCLALAARKRP